MIPLSNSKKQHHYISQAEQKLNAIDADASSPRWIYRFCVVDREAPAPLGRAHRTGIRGSLWDKDLFTFDVEDDTYRRNLEDWFGGYMRAASRSFRRRCL